MLLMLLKCDLKMNNNIYNKKKKKQILTIQIFIIFSYLDILSYILVILSLDILSIGYFNLGYFDLDVLLQDILFQYLCLYVLYHTYTLGASNNI
jgi:hypothetical protein